ncbi:VanZ family protein [Cohnella sp. AR92]|uniref:VanZ family protein n=1 Tax=Cohnella sp. AR92 TaxID=648716 RepID=UPI000F8DA548|nr:VanZ family protein [Cohnella sp. AR92]RUS45021.1 VanZ family protein [Cohnella sp. AR92]
MFHSYLFPISYAFYTFPIAAAVFTLPFLIVQYRRHGYIHKYRAILLYLLLLYLLNAVYLIVLPFPSTVHNQPPEHSYFQLIPFHFLADIGKETEFRIDQPSTYLHLLKERAFLQVAFNVALTIPFGLFLRYYFRAKWTLCLFFSLGLSLFFEVTQVTGIYGIFDYPYRLFDVDDLMTNTLGGMIGYVAADWLASLLPRIDRLDETVDLSTKRVTYTRRGIAFLIDWAILLPVGAVLAVLHLRFAYLPLVIVYFIAIPYATNGLTAGKWVVRIRVKGLGERIRLRELAVRYGLLYVIVGGVNMAYPIIAVRSTSPWVNVPYAVGLFAMDLWFAVHLIRCFFNRKRKLFYEKRSNTGHVIT